MHPMLCVGDGHSYEQAAIIQWLQTHSTSPVTEQPLATADLLPNHALRQVSRLPAGNSMHQLQLLWSLRRRQLSACDTPEAVGPASGCQLLSRPSTEETSTIYCWRPGSSAILTAAVPAGQAERLACGRQAAPCSHITSV